MHGSGKRRTSTGGRAASRAGGRRGPIAPPASPELIEVSVSRIGAQGDGLAEHAGRPLFIPLTVPGDRVRVRLAEACGNGWSAEVVETVSSGPGRAEPPCPHFGRCGGCRLQHMADGHYSAWKLERLSGALARAGLAGAEVASLARTAPGARRRATFAAVRPAGGAREALLGFNVRRGHEIVDLSSCAVLDPAIVRLVPALRTLMTALLAPGQRSSVAVSALEGGLDVVVEWPAEPGLRMRERLAAFATDHDVARLSWRRSGKEVAEPVVQVRPVGAVFAGALVAVPPGSFLQASREGEAALANAVTAAASLAREGEGESAVADLFAGAGTFALPLARGGARVHAVDADEASLRALAAVRGVRGLTVECRNLFSRPMTAAEVQPFLAVVLDPPRAGAAAQCAALAGCAVPAIIYVSCNPDAFARDARTLVAGGYRLEQVTPVDQFLWSAHLELVAVFRR